MLIGLEIPSSPPQMGVWRLNCGARQTANLRQFGVMDAFLLAKAEIFLKKPVKWDHLSNPGNKPNPIS